MKLEVALGYRIVGEVAVSTQVLHLSRGLSIGIFGRDRVRSLKVLVTQLVQEHSTIILDTEGVLRNLRFPSEVRYLALSHNATLPLSELLPRGAELHTRLITLTDLVAGALNLNELEKLVLQQALLRTVLSGDPSPLSLRKFILEELTKLSTVEKVRTYTLLTLAEDLRYGRLRAALELGGEVPDTTTPQLLDLTLVPPRYRGLLLYLLLYYLTTRGLEDHVLVLTDLTRYSDVLSRSPVPRTLLLELAERNWILFTAESILTLPEELREYVEYVVQHRVHTSTEARALADFYRVPEDTLTRLGVDEAYVISARGRYRVRIWSDIIREEVRELPPEKVRIEEPAPQPLLRELFSEKSELVYEVLNYLRRGAVTRDELLTFITEGLGLESTVAAHLITELSLHGLIDEFVARDGRYWLRISVKGLLACEEYERWRAGGESR